MSTDESRTPTTAEPGAGGAFAPREDVEQLRLIADALPVVIAYVDHERRYRFVNRRYGEWFGLAPEEVVGRHVREVVGEAAYAAVQPEMERVFAGEELSFERLLPYAAGGDRYVHVNYVPDIDPATGLVRGYCALVSDITESREAQERLRESEARFAKAFSASPLVLTISSLKTGKLLEVNETFVNVTGFTREEAIGRTTVELGLWARPAEREAEMETVRRAGQVRNAEYLFRMRDGSEIVGLLSAEHVEIGGESYALTVIQDITERKREELDRQFLLELSERIRSGEDGPEEFLDGVAESACRHAGAARALFIEIDEAANRGTIRHEYCRPGVASVAGVYPISDYSPRTLEEARAGRVVVNHDARRDPRTADIYEAVYEPNGERAYVSVPLFTGGRWTAIFWVSDDRPRRWTPQEVALIGAVGERAWLAAERRRVEREREELLAREQAARLQAEEASRLKDEFLATISHELRTPLTAILGWSHMLRTGGFDGAATARALETIHRNAQAQAQLVEDILDVSRIITGKMRLEARPVSLAPLVQTAVESLRPAVEAKSIRLRLELDFEPRMVYADPDRLQQVVWNLLSNAVKFTPERGQVTVGLASGGAQTTITISDTGEGIGPEFLPHVFERFRQADGSRTRKHGGLGLGLAIVRHIVELHGGTVEAKSAGTGRGATFTVRLPLTETAPSAGTYAAASAPHAGGREAASETLAGQRVLLLDDEEDTLDMLAAVLAQSGAEVRRATSVSSALEVVRAWRPDVVVSDIAMPEEDGYTFIRRLRSLAPEEGGATPVVALTAYVGVRERSQILASGFQLYVPKPIDPPELLRALASLA